MVENKITFILLVFGLCFWLVSCIWVIINRHAIVSYVYERVTVEQNKRKWAIAVGIFLFTLPAFEMIMQLLMMLNSH